MRVHRNFNKSYFFCQECRKLGMTVYRRKGTSREKGHIKDLYCIYCMKVTHHLELRNDLELYEFKREKLIDETLGEKKEWQQKEAL